MIKDNSYSNDYFVDIPLNISKIKDGSNKSESPNSNEYFVDIPLNVSKIKGGSSKAEST